MNATESCFTVYLVATDIKTGFKKKQIMHELMVSLRWKWNMGLAVKSGIWDVFLLDRLNALGMCVREERKDGYCELTFALQR